jgi:hypothetical protein
MAGDDARPSEMELTRLFELDLDTDCGQLRAAPVNVDGDICVLLVHAADAEVDPYMKMFFYPEDTLTFTFVDASGSVCWERDLGRGVVPGIWFCPVFPFDLDGDGTDSIWFVDNVDDKHPFDLDNYRLARLDPRSGEVTGRWEWPVPVAQKFSHRYRNFILGGHADGDPVLVTAQGTYGEMTLQGWDSDLSRRWNHTVAADGLGARGSHMCPVLDLDDDGSDEVLWGERAISLDDGTELFCADREKWDGHSDVVQPTRREDGGWYIYTVRESNADQAPRVVTYDDEGERVWSVVESGHIDMGWTARLEPDASHVAMAIRIGNKTAGTSGFGREGVEEFRFDAYTGEERDQPYPLYGAVPVDLDGDGLHELAYGGPRGSDVDGDVRDGKGELLGNFEGTIAMASKFLDHPGEQILTYTAGGHVAALGDANTEDTDRARERYDHPYYEKAQRLTAVGYNWVNLGGL